VGRDLINTAALRGQITQIQQYQTAVNAFEIQYNALPGDLNSNVATQYGFTPRGAYPGQGDGNGLIEGVLPPYSSCGYDLDNGETALFWVDLTTANGLNLNLINGSFSTGLAGPGTTLTTPAAIATVFPVAKIGQGNFIYVTSAGVGQSAGVNYFGISAIYQVDGAVRAKPGITAQQAYYIDNKIDDGLPQSGSVTAMYLNNAWSYSWQIWAGQTFASSSAATPSMAATAGTTSTCFDNGNTNNAVQQYSVEMNSNNLNCALSFQFQ
jgi:hypothetical protein